MELRPIRSARRLRLRFDERRNLLTLTCPVRTSRRAALAWAAEQKVWVEAQIAQALPGVPFAPGAVIPLDGREVRLEWAEAAPRMPRLDGDVLRCGGPPEAFARRIESFLRRLALETLSRDSAEIGARAELRPSAVSVGDPDSRWGSCTSERRIRYSWRLILAPAEVRRYVVAHEIAHLRHLNHGPEFKALEAVLFGGPTAGPRRSLVRIGPGLKRFGRGR